MAAGAGGTERHLNGTIYFIRHGQSVVNLASSNSFDKERVYYRPEFIDAKLSDAGRAQAAALQGLFGQDFRIDFVLGSTLYRALETATIALSVHIPRGAIGADGSTNSIWLALDSLRESDEEFPPRQGDDTRLAKPCNARRSLTEDRKPQDFAHFDFNRYSIDVDYLQSETFLELNTRIKLFAKQLHDIVHSAERHPDQEGVTVVAVSHYVFLRGLTSSMAGSDSKLDLANCGVIKLPLQQVLDLMT